MAKGFQATDHLANVLHRHLDARTALVDGRIVCKCRMIFDNERRFAEHLAVIIEAAFSDVIEAERIDAQLSLLAGAVRFWGPSNGRTTPRSRNVYSGAQIANWCRDKAISLHRVSGQSMEKPPRPTHREGTLP